MPEHAEVVPWVLAAIAKVKGQKQQPNEERICQVLLQSYGVGKEQGLLHLQQCVDEGFVSCTLAKNGKNSYRNAKAVPGVKPPFNHLQLKKCLDEIISNPPRPEGMSLEEIENELRCNRADQVDLENPDFTAHFKNSLKKGLTKGRFTKEGKYIKMAPITPAVNRIIKPKFKKEEGQEEDDDEEITQAEREALKEICGFCKGDKDKNKYGDSEDLLTCNECGNSGHPTCMQYSKELTIRVREEPWQCMECKKCNLCKEQGEAANLLFCDACDKGYHMECLTPPLDDMPIGSWICEICVNERNGKRRRPSQSVVPASLLHSPDHSPNARVGLKRKPDDETRGCTTPNCDGKGHSTGKHDHHRSVQFCPLVNKKKKTGDGDSENENKTRLPGVTDKDEEMFRNAQEKANSYVTANNEPVVPNNNARCPPKIEFGRYEIETWYSSRYPQEYASAPKIYLCEFCLKYMKTRTILKRHMMKCSWTHPPANEIYRKENLSVFEVDGAVSKIYCQNLCLLAKLFLDHKIVYFDVEPFLFYVLTKNDSTGSHLVGYFSKEKACEEKYNVSCIMTMPQYQRQGYGRFLIDFSYVLSRIEGQPGSPEKPLSDLGLITYRNYWKSVIGEYLYKHMYDKAVTIKSISQSTGMDPHDIASTLQQLNVVQLRNGKVTIVINEKVMADHMAKINKQKRIPIDEEALRWTPLVQSGNPSQIMKDAQLSSEDEDEPNESNSKQPGDGKVAESNQTTEKVVAENSQQQLNGESTTAIDKKPESSETIVDQPTEMQKDENAEKTDTPTSEQPPEPAEVSEETQETPNVLESNQQVDEVVQNKETSNQVNTPAEEQPSTNDQIVVEKDDLKETEEKVENEVTTESIVTPMETSVDDVINSNDTEVANETEQGVNEGSSKEVKNYQDEEKEQSKDEKAEEISSSEDLQKVEKTEHCLNENKPVDETQVGTVEENVPEKEEASQVEISADEAKVSS